MAITVTDQMGVAVTIPHFPERIISLVPSLTELLFDLGLDEEIAAVTRFCIHPADRVREKPTIGGTKKFNLARIRALSPDLIIGNKEENYPEGIAALRERFPVWMSDVVTLDDALAMIRSIAGLVGRPERGAALAADIADGFRSLADLPPLRAAYLIWRNPWMAAGGHTFIDSMMAQGGLINVFTERYRYPEITLDAIREAAPDAVLLSSEPFPFDESHRRELAAELGGVPVICVDGMPFSWYGSRLLSTPSALRRLRARLSE